MPGASGLDRLIERMEMTSYSTAFSGIDSPGTAFSMLRVIAGMMVGADVKAPDHLHAIESWILTKTSRPTPFIFCWIKLNQVVLFVERYVCLNYNFKPLT